MVSLTEEVARGAAARVVDPEMPMLTLADLGVLRDVAVDDEAVTVWITPTYSGCPATATMRDDLVRALQETGFARVEVRLRLDPAWSSDWLSDRGREARARARTVRAPRARQVRCPRCGSAGAQLTSEFGPTACTALYRCGACLEPFEHMKEI